MNRKQMMTVMALFVVVAGIVSIPTGVYAQGTAPAPRANFFQNLVQFISDKFGLDRNRVQSAVTQYRQQRRQMMLQTLQQRAKAHLDKLVAQGKLTPAQETAVMNEYNSLITKYNLKNLNTMTPQQRQTQLLNAGNELKSWAQSQGIDPTLITPGFQWAKAGLGMRYRARMRLSVTPVPGP